ncbi:TonB-dependent receptor [Sphingomonas crocodyli]|uniref:TonB-dependent receptor n=1 Tax=Sphingomonas crocodyli TaxID=1979270 RepID=A0A437M0T9_9SPHN|nr:TonB-dependent receptor [Sphingomonas crocodyli]RVT91196.1 TonB-dependent receptor [Sphingomonas crocodyli]
MTKNLKIAALAGSALALTWSSLAFAQTTPVPEADAAIDGAEILVTGYQLQNLRSTKSKRDAVTISEFVTADDAGQNPDYNIADALRRVPGVAAVFDEDEGRYVAVRGLNPDYTLVTFNGLQLASSDQNSRRVLIEQVPASAVGRMEVVKSLTPAMDGNAIGGLVDLRTRSAFDVNDTYFSAQTLLGYYDSNAVPGKGKPSFRADATLSTRFGPDDSFGIMLTGSYMERTRDQERIIVPSIGYYTASGAVATNPLTQAATGVPNGALFLNYALTSKRWGGAGTLEYKPHDDFYASLYYGRYTQDDDETRYGVTLTPTGVPAITSATTGRVAVANASVSTSQFVISKPVDTVQSRMMWKNDRSKLDLAASYSQARWDEIGPGATFVSGNRAGLGYTYDAAGVPRFTFNDPAAFSNTGNYTFTSASSTDFNVRERVKALKGDFRQQFGDSIWSLGLGGAFKNVERTVDRETPSWTRAGTPLTLDQFDRTENYIPPYATAAMPLLNRTAFWDFLNGTPGAFNQAPRGNGALSGDYRFRENVTAAYALIEARGDNFHLVAGGRYEKTDVKVGRFAVVNGAILPVAEKNDYDDFLPSAVFSYDLTEGLKLRAAYAKSIGRPNQTDLAGGEARTETAGIVTISRPNPALKPRRADNFDLSAEYYFDGNNGLISAGVFHKNVKDEIFRGTTQVVTGALTTIISEPQNLSSAKLTGLEFNAVMNSLPFLPDALSGLGASLNYTYIHTDASIVMANGTLRKVDQLLEQPKRMLNASVFYKDRWFEGRLSYSRPGVSYQSISTASAVQDISYKPFNQLDAQVRIKVTDQVQFVAEGRNLLGESRDSIYSQFGEVREINAHGRGFWAGISFRY